MSYKEIEHVDADALTTLSRGGTELALRGGRKEIIPGVDVVAACHAIRIGRGPINEALKTG